jgi:hypothetical protein
MLMINLHLHNIIRQKLITFRQLRLNLLDLFNILCQHVIAVSLASGGI